VTFTAAVKVKRTESVMAAAPQKWELFFLESFKELRKERTIGEFHAEAYIRQCRMLLHMHSGGKASKNE
jgi:hypothetical protein